MIYGFGVLTRINEIALIPNYDPEYFITPALPLHPPRQYTLLHIV